MKTMVFGMPVWVVYALLSMFFAGLTSVLAKSGLNEVSADTGLAIRTSVVFVFILINAFVWRQSGNLSSLSGRSLVFLLFSGLTTSLSWVCYYRAMKTGPVSEVATIDKGSILITLLLSFLVLREPITLKLLTGAMLVLAGLLVLIWK